MQVPFLLFVYTILYTKIYKGSAIGVIQWQDLLPVVMCIMQSIM